MSRCERHEAAEGVAERSVFRVLLAINAAMFALELVLGLVAGSIGLVADSLDMLADAGGYGLALHAVGRSGRIKAGAARFSGWSRRAGAAGRIWPSAAPLPSSSSAPASRS